MPVQFIQAVPAGNAVNFLLAPPRGAVSWRVLRRPADAFTGPDDPAAFVVADDLTDRDVLDIIGLVNGTLYHYRIYYRDAAGAWMPVVDSAVAAPMATYKGDALDPQMLVRDRLEAGLAVEVQRGVLKPAPRAQRIEVLLAPFAVAEQTQFPVVTVHLDRDGPEVRAIGEAMEPDLHKRSGGWAETTGWLSRVSLNVVGASLNPNERLTLRRALKRIVQANLGIFAARGLNMVEFHQRDHEDAEHFNVPIYFTIGSFTCLAPAWVTDDVAEVRDVEVTAHDFTPGETDHG